MDKEPPFLQSLATSVWERTSAAITLPGALVQDAVDRLHGSTELAQERLYIARHEAAHALFMVLSGNDRILEARIGHLRRETCCKLKLTLGGEWYAGTVDKSNEMPLPSPLAASAIPHYRLLMPLAGLAVTKAQFPETFARDDAPRIQKHLPKLQYADWSDVAFSTEELYYLLRKRGIQYPTVETISPMFHELIDILGGVLAQDACARCVEAIATIFLQHGRLTGPGVHERIIAQLTASGISGQTLQRAAEQIASIDVHQIIERHAH